MSEKTRVESLREREPVREREREKVKEKDQPSQFDRVLKERVLTPQAAQVRQTSQTATEQAVRHEQRRDEGGKGGREDREDGERKESGKSSSAEGKTSVKVAEQKVVAKHGLSGDGGGQGGRGGQGGGRGGFSGHREGVKSTSKLSSVRQAPVSLRAQFAKTLATAAKMPQRDFTQQILNKLVQYVRIGMNEEGEKEIKIDLHEKVFKGLKLKVAAKGKGKVSVHFATSDSSVRELFMHNRSAIERALKKKGIEVAEISIT